VTIYEPLELERTNSAVIPTRSSLSGRPIRASRPVSQTRATQAVLDPVVSTPSVSTAPSATVGRSAGSRLKRLVDILGAAVGLLLLAPVLVAIGLLIRLDGSGPALYRQVRVGLGGRRFSIVKFRTMYCDAEERLAELKRHNEMSGPLFKLAADPRITPLGRVLRKFSLDEFPQLWNVLRGHMSLVGPRPALPREVSSYCDKAARRLEAVPGMTGAWQVGGRSTLEWQAGLDLDIHYVDNWSLRYDFVILLKTIRAVVRPVGAY
jgi:lipopolysaccharide/colanic/teichoic acid biosynthesis glycosyltransferase